MKCAPGIIAVLLLGFGLAAQNLIVPANVDAATNGNASTSYPWGRDSAIPTNNDIRVQYVYDTSNFASITNPILIDSLRFRADDTSSTWTGGDYVNCEVWLGEASLDYTSLSAANTFDSNYLEGVTPASPNFSGTVSCVAGTGNGSGLPGPWYVTVPLTSPFFYDPAQGHDLVLDFRWDGTFTGLTTGAWNSNAQTTGAMARRVFNEIDGLAPLPTTASDVTIVCELGYSLASGIVASFAVSDSNTQPGAPVTFTDTSFTSDPGGIVAWSWDFNGDGTPDSTQQNPTYTYGSSECGPNDVTLEVFDATATDSITQVGSVFVGAPVASFTPSATQGSIPLTVNFTNTSQGATTYDWDLDGDGAFGDDTTANPSWTYTTEALTTVTLRATNSCGTSEASVEIDTRTQLCTQFGGITGWNGNSSGFYYDIEILNPAGITVTNMAVQIQNLAVPVSIRIYAKPGTHVGHEGNRDAWTLVSTGSGVGTGTPNPTPIDVSDFSLAPGQWAFAIEYVTTPATERFNYSQGSVPTQASNVDIALSNGAMWAPIFVGSTLFSPRNWNGCIDYEVGMTGGSLTQLGAGCVNSTGETSLLSVVSGAPNTDTQMLMELSRAPANQALCAVLVGVANIGPIDLTLIGMDGCDLFPQPIATLMAPTNVSGEASAQLSLNGAQVGLPILLQAFTADPGFNGLGAVLSNALIGTIGQ